jgi:hypothetical protein
MDTRDDRSFIARHPFETLVISAIVLALLGIVLVFTVVGALVGLPLMAIAALLGLWAWHRFRRHATRV